uniref:DDE-1 domain-containing protein n=1 Tax=Scleropages formosus TaxID=113540 RepID=A0A8C9TAJ9_SCLFO
MGGTAYVLDYVQSYFCPFIAKYCKENNLGNKALLIIENAPGHPATIVDYSSNVQVVFLPSNTTFLLQPMEQGVISIFKAYYMQLVMQYLVSGLNKNDKVTVRDLWKNYSINMAIENIAIAWDKVRGNTMNAVWKKLPEAVHDIHCFETMRKTICLDIVQLAVKAGFNEVNIEDVQELLGSHSEDLSDDKLYQQEENFLKENAEPLKDGIFNKAEETVKEFGTKELRSLFSLIDTRALLDENDGNFERAHKAKIPMRESIECYKQLYNKKVRETKQRSVLPFSRLATPAAASESQTLCSEISHPTVAMEEVVASADDPEILELEENRHSLSSSLFPSFCTPCSPVPQTTMTLLIFPHLVFSPFHTMSSCSDPSKQQSSR